MLKIKKKAPNFKGLNQDGEEMSLSDFKGKKLALYFYPESGTPTCTVQACNIRDNYSALKKAGIAIVGVSPDTNRKQGNFTKKHELPFPIISDKEKKIIETYGVWGQKKMFGREYMGLIRTTFLIDEKGVLVHIIEKPVAKNHSQQIIDGFEN